MSLAGDKTTLELLRRPFPPKLIGKLPKTDKRPALDYVGHAAVTDRLIAADPDWTYKVDERFDHGGQCWIGITVTVGGVSRPEYGDGKDPKEALGNAIRRGAMRFGVALDLWSKEELIEASAASSPTRSHAAPDGSGRDGAAEEREAGGESGAYGEGAAGEPPASQPTDAQRWMDEFHPGKPHRMKRSETVPKMTFCTQGNGKCPYAVMEEAKSNA